MEDLPESCSGPKQILVEFPAWWICHTDWDEAVPPETPMVLGHQIVGRVEGLGSGATKFSLGDRVGITWINSACGKCHFLQGGHENLCSEFQGTGCHVHGGLCAIHVVSEDFAYLIPERFSDAEGDPALMCWRDWISDLILSGIKKGPDPGTFWVWSLCSHCRSNGEILGLRSFCLHKRGGTSATWQSGLGGLLDRQARGRSSQETSLRD